MTDKTDKTDKTDSKQKKLFQTPTKAQNRQRAVAWTLRTAMGAAASLSGLRRRIDREATANMENSTGDYFQQLKLDIERCQLALDKLTRSAHAANLRIHGQYLLEQEEKIPEKTQKEG
jgi:hypothetical protein